MDWVIKRLEMQYAGNPSHLDTTKWQANANYVYDEIANL